ncbi:hypothetical protein N7452_008726 [Penicillium brevicompactum]|uniref:ubiquitinyl hydrolase 1 n=1 Tax=Penicillium brevicompactum TaxID=5074 RepID=A0A9W9Q7A2_PENBR|nr:hypothetical protein N7452_008726 [Penicillium brevicompactum]
MKTQYWHSETVSSNPSNPSYHSHYEAALGMLENNTVITSILSALCFVLILLNYFGLPPISLLQLSWDLLVYITPSRIVVAFDPHMSNTEAIARDSSLPLQQKSDAMVRILGGISASSPIPCFTQPRSLSAFGNALLGSTNDAAPAGLGNWNNSCFQNSIIQGLASLKSLVDFLGRNIDNTSPKISLETHKALLDLIENLNSASNHGRKLWIEGPLKSMSSWQQQDAQEYFHKVVHQIDMEAELASRGEITNVGLKLAGPEENIVQGSRYDGPRAEKTDPASLALDVSYNPLEGLLAQRVGCMDCGYSEGLSLIPFNCLTVPLGGSHQYDIRDCLDHYMTLEPIEGVECAKCTLLQRREQLVNLIGGMNHDSQSDDPHTPNPFDAVKLTASERLGDVTTALESNDYSENTLAQKCHISSKNRVSTTKSRQAVIARAPKCLTIHINRSLFDEMTGDLVKNHTAVVFPQMIDLNPWCLGTQNASKSGDKLEQWETNPCRSMLPRPDEVVEIPSRLYQLRAVITHYGRHENGHYVCYRKYPTSEFTAPPPDEILQVEGDKDKPERWWRLSDDDVQMVSESFVMSQKGAFMLFYEAIDESVSSSSESPASSAYTDSFETAYLASADSTATSFVSDDFSAPSTVTDLESSTSRATSVSMPWDEAQPNLPHTKQANICDVDINPNDEVESPPAVIA